MFFALFIMGLFVFFIFLSTLFSHKAYRRGVKAGKVLLVQLLSFVVSIFTCSTLALASTAQDGESSSSSKVQTVQSDRNGSNEKGMLTKPVADSSSQGSSNSSKGLGYLAMAICMGLACLGAGIAVAAAAPAAIGAVSEDKKSFGTSLVFVALAEGVTVFGLLISIFIYNGLRE